MRRLTRWSRVPCPTCKARQGAPCVGRPHGKPTAAHASRIRAARRQLELELADTEPASPLAFRASDLSAEEKDRLFPPTRLGQGAGEPGSPVLASACDAHGGKPADWCPVCRALGLVASPLPEPSSGGQGAPRSTYWCPDPSTPNLGSGLPWFPGQRPGRSGQYPCLCPGCGRPLEPHRRHWFCPACGEPE